MEVGEMHENGEWTERLEAATALLERASGLMASLEERQRFLNGEVEKISATVETSRREEELLARLEAAQRELVEIKEIRAAAQGPLPKALEPLRKTLPTATAEMLSKHGIGESAIDVRALDAALVGLSLEQRIAVKSQLRRAGAMA